MLAGGDHIMSRVPVPREKRSRENNLTITAAVAIGVLMSDARSLKMSAAWAPTGIIKDWRPGNDVAAAPEGTRLIGESINRSTGTQRKRKVRSGRAMQSGSSHGQSASHSPPVHLGKFCWGSSSFKVQRGPTHQPESCADWHGPELRAGRRNAEKVGGVVRASLKPARTKLYASGPQGSRWGKVAAR